MMKKYLLFCSKRMFRCLLALAVLWSGSVALQAQTYLIDLGRNNGTDGNATSSPDAAGHYWNNIQSATQATTGNRTATDLVDTANGTSSIGVELVGNWQANGRNHGGLFGANGPQTALLGDLAVETATEDFYYLSASESTTGTVVITGLSASDSYHVLLFGSRSTTVETRETTFSASGRSTAITTSGTGVGSNGSYSGNDSALAGLFGVTPNGAGTVIVQVEISEGGFGYINAIKIQRRPSLAESRILIDFGPLSGRHSVGSDDANGNRWNYVTGGDDTIANLVSAANTGTGHGLAMSDWTGMNGLPSADWDIVEGELDTSLHGGRFGFYDVVKNGAFFDSSRSPTLTLSGLDDSKVYNLTFYGARGNSTRTTTYSVGAASDSLQTGTGSPNSWNTSDVAQLLNISPTAGSIIINVTQTGGFGYLNAMEIESAVRTTVSNTVAMLESDGVTELTGNSGSGSLVQLIAVGPNGRIDLPVNVSPNFGTPGGDDYLVDALNNPTHVGAGMAGADIGQLIQTMVYNESLAGTAVYIRYWDAETLDVDSLYGNSPIFYLPAAGTPGQTQVDFLPADSVAPVVQYTIPGFTTWTLLLLAVVIAVAYYRRHIRATATV